jgi:hypothetical protein
MLERAWAILASRMGWSDRELARERKRHDTLAAALREKYGPLPPGSGYKAMLERAKLINEIDKQRNREGTQ